MTLSLLRFRLLRLVRRLDVAGWLAATVLVVVMLAAIASPLSGYAPGLDVDVTVAHQGPGAAHLLGTDHLGRDTFWRLVLACRAFVFPGLLACLTAATLGVPAGAVAGLRGGFTAGVVRYVSTVVMSVPRFVLVLLSVAIYGNDPVVLAIAAGCAYAPALSEDIFGRIEGLRSAEYLVASEAHGLSDARVLWVHLVLGACGGIVARHLLLLFGYVVVLETTLSYLGGLGVQEPTPSWGNMLVFEWGRGGSWVSRSAPAIALWLTIAATVTLAARLGEARRG